MQTTTSTTKELDEPIIMASFHGLSRSASIGMLSVCFASDLPTRWPQHGEPNMCTTYHSIVLTAARVSATNSARIYNLEAENRMVRLPQHWNHSLDLSTETVWDAFFLNGLILDAKERNTALELRHDVSDQATRFRPALEARNERMVGPGHELWNHACNVCCARRELNGRTGKLPFKAFYTYIAELMSRNVAVRRL